jgi:hypothetical protein
MTFVISIAGLVTRFAGDLLTTAMGWASTLLFGRVQRSHQVLVAVMLAGSLLWLFLLVAALAPVVSDVALDITPHPAAIGRSLVRTAVLVGLVLVPLGVGVAAYLVPSDEARPEGLRILVELARGFLLTPVLGALLLFLPAVGISRKVRSVRHGWSDTHIPVVVKPHGYDRVVADLQHTLARSDLPVEARDAPAVLSFPAWLLTTVAGPNVQKLRADRLVELVGPALRIGIYPSDVAISGPSLKRDRARAVIISRLSTTAAHLTTSAEGQAIEDRLTRLAEREHGEAVAEAHDLRREFEDIDRTLLDLPVAPDEWDTLYRIRLQVERDILAGADPAAPLQPVGAASRRAPDGRRSAAQPIGSKATD